MSSPKIKNTPSSHQCKVGLFSKQEGAEAIAKGARHIHSSVLGIHDPCWRVTQSLLSGAKTRYPWEIASDSRPLVLTHSNERTSCFNNICSSTQFGTKSQNRERLKLVMEELFSNGFYHAYKNAIQEDKYDRLKPVSLSKGEEITVCFEENQVGLHLVIEDRGGSLSFADFIRSFGRCFNKTQSHITFDEKHAGAGIGLYLIFELASHLHLSMTPGERTRFSIWLSNSNQFDPDSFSFNFFEE